MIVIYTFDFKKKASETSKNEQYMMLVASIQSALENIIIKPKICIYSGDQEFISRIYKEFGTQITIIKNEKKKYCDNDDFTCAGHARINAILDFIDMDDVLYLDNDTLIKPDGLYTLKTKYPLPCGYRKEEWYKLKKWIKEISKSNQQYKCMTAMCKPWSNEDTINNGVQYYPQSYISKTLALNIKHNYQRLLKNCGYTYGLDQVVYTLSLYEMNLHQLQIYNNGITNTVWHAYCVKDKYINNLKKIGLYSETNINILKRKNVYDKLKFLNKQRIIFNQNQKSRELIY